MDADSTDGSAIDVMNGDTKTDAAKLAQSAIIKRDVMLSGTSTQSPVSSVLTLPNVSMPTGSLATATLATSLTGSLHDSLFLGAVPSLTTTDTGHEKHESALCSQASQLLGQPQVAPQFIIAGQQAATNPGTATVPLQQILIPVSAGNGTQQLLSIPLSLATGAGGQLQLIQTSSGQLLATNLGGLSQALSMAITNQAATQTQPLYVMGPQVQQLHLAQWLGQGVAQIHTAPATQATSQLPQQQNTQPTVTMAASSPSVNGQQQQPQQQQQQAGLPQLIANAQGQIVAIGSPQMLQQAVATVTQANSPTLAAPTQVLAAVQQANGGHGTTAQQLVTSARLNGLSLHGATQLQNTVQVQQLQSPAVNHSTISLGGTTATVSIPTPVSSSMITQHAVINSSSSSSTITPNINQLLPNTISSADAGTVVDGVNLDEIREFAKQFKIRRLSLGLTQTQVGQALSATEGPSYSQSAICRFEKLDITPKSAQKIKPVLERWMAEAEERYKNGMDNLSDFIGSEPSKKRKRRTSFTPSALEVLNEYFERNTHPSGAEMTELSSKLNYDREVIRVWFCNKRQALKNTIKKLKTSDVS